MRRSLKYLGVVLIIVGAMLTVMPTAGFSNIAGERGVDVSIADDNSAFVAISDSDRVVRNPGGAQVTEIVNNLESSVTVQYEASVDTNALEVEEPSDTVTIFEGSAEPIEVRCTPSVGGSGTATLQIDIIEAQGDSATVTDATLETTVEYRCPPPSKGGGKGGGNPGNGDPGNSNGRGR